jgi:uncharacterized surface protein with fasciclin (FAS1) repeats
MEIRVMQIMPCAQNNPPNPDTFLSEVVQYWTSIYLELADHQKVHATSFIASCKARPQGQLTDGGRTSIIDRESLGKPRRRFQMKKIIETAVTNGSLKTLVTAVKAADLAETLSKPGPFTIFAPNDEAFAKLPEGALEELLKDIPKLRRLLAYHVVSGKAMAADVMKLSSAKTVQGQNVAITSDMGIKVNGARVIKMDIACDNGVIHVIDTVLTLSIPKSPPS